MPNDSTITPDQEPEYTEIVIPQAMADRIEFTMIGLSELIEADIKANDGKASETQRKLIHTQTVLMEVLVRVDIEPGPHCLELLAGSGFDLADLDGEPANA